MSIEPHGMPRNQFMALAQLGGNTEAIEALVAAQHSKHMILLYGVKEAAQPDDRLAVAGYELLAEVQRSDPGAAAEVIRHPSVGAWALHTLRGDQLLPWARPSGLAAVAAAAVIRAGMDLEIEVPVSNGSVLLPSLGIAAASGDTAMVRTGAKEICSGDLRVPLRCGEPGWRGLRHVQAGPLKVLIDDVDPFRMPATDGEPTGRLTQRQLAELAGTLNDAWGLLDPASAAEIAALVRVIVPYHAPADGFVSTTSPLTFGTIALSQPPDRYTCAETLIHEAQHLKLCALLDLVRLTYPDDGRRYYAPWRDDPRPASGLIQGVYAFLGVTGFWRRQRTTATGTSIEQRADAEFARWRDCSALAARTLLASGQLTSAGHDFVTEIAELLEAWQAEHVSERARGIARRKANLHKERWQSSYGHVETVTVPA